MTLQTIYAAPGVTKAVSDYAAEKALGYVATTSGLRTGQGRWIDATNIEFIAGFPQKTAGWTQALSAQTIDIPRCTRVWRGNLGVPLLGVGTQTHLYVFDGTTLTNITPLRSLSTGTLTDALTTVANSQIVTVADTSGLVQNLDWVFLSAASSVGGLLIDGWYQASSATGSGYSITSIIPAPSSGGPGGGSIAYSYPRIILTNPFTTTMGSNVVQVLQAGHNAVTGNYVIFSGASAVGGITLSGEYVVTVIDGNNYTVTAATAATSGATGGGSVNAVFEINIEQQAFSPPEVYGIGAYGAGGYSAGQTNVPILTNGWTMDAYGYQLLSAPIGGTIYVYDPSFGGTAYPLLNAPPTITAMFVTAERFVVALGINGSLLEMAWADQNDYTDWTTTPLNTANSGRTLVGGSFFVGGISVTNGVSLVFSDRCCFGMNYTGDNEVYATPLQGDNCGLVDPTAVVVMGGIAYWFSDRNFWSWSGGVTALPSDDIRQYVFEGGINLSFLSKVTAGSNRAKLQIRFFYPNASATENNVGLIYQVDAQCWSTLSYGKSTYVDANLFSNPISTDILGMIYFEESGTDANGSPLPYNLEFGDLDIASGAQNANVFGFIPDVQSIAGPHFLQINTKYYPADQYTVDGPYALTTTTGSGYGLIQRQDLRSDGKLFGFQVNANALGATMRFGLPRLDVSPAGARN